MPLEQVLGWAEFCGLRILVAPTVFVPRRRTELLVRLALESLRAGDVVVDLGCGTGAIAAALLAAEPSLDAHAADLDPAAVACARRNLPPDRVHEGDLYDALPAALRGRIAVIAANAPYVPTDEISTMPSEARDHEARVALDGGPDGLDVQRRVVADAPRWLVPGGVVLVETSRAQASGTAAAMASAGLDRHGPRGPRDRRHGGGGSFARSYTSSGIARAAAGPLDSATPSSTSVWRRSPSPCAPQPRWGVAAFGGRRPANWCYCTSNAPEIL